MNLHIDSKTAGTREGAGAGHSLMSVGLCCRSQSFRAASMRVCQPVPVDLNASMTSGEYLMVVDFLVGSADTGLPRRMSFLPSCKLALSKKASSSSGASSGSTQVLFKSFNFAFISFPHRDNAARLSALRPDHNNKPGIQFAYGDIPDFAVVLPVILAGKVNSGENFIGSGEINSALQQRSLSFVLVEFNFHAIIVVTLIKKSKLDYLNSGRYSSCTTTLLVVGCGSPEFVTAHNRAQAVFLCVTHSHTQFMVGRAGQPSGWPGSVATGTSTPVRLTTSKCGSFGGELSILATEAAIMATILTQTQPELHLVEGRIVTTSLAIAAYFSKDHKNVIQKIQSLGCSPKFTELNFQLSEYSDSTGRKLPCYEITRDGFAFLAMGFTGKRAAIFKENYIDAFNRMEASLTSHTPALPEYIRLIVTIKDGALIDSRPMREGEITASIDDFFEMAERQGYLVIHADDLKSLSLGRKAQQGARK